MGHKGKGDDFLEGRIADENLESAQHGHTPHCPPGTQPTTILCQGTAPLPITLICNPQIGPECCWIILATTNCTTTRPNGTTCCWRLLATTDCTTTRGGEACCWQILATTDCTSTCDQV